MLGWSIVLTALLFLALGDFTYEDPEIYGHLDKRFVDKDEEGYLYLSSFDLGHIIRYDPQGKIVGRIGKKGPGPGEFEILGYFSYCQADQKLYAFDIKATFINVFSKTGELLSTIKKPPGYIVYPFKTEKGWVLQEIDSKTWTIGVARYDTHFKERQFLLDIKGFPGGKPGIRLDRYTFRMTRDDRYFFIYEPEKPYFELTIVDLRTNNIKRVRNPEIKAIVLDEIGRAHV